LVGRTILLGTRKGLLVLERGTGDDFDVARVDFPGIPVAYAARDPRSGRLWACLEHGHWGPKLHRSDERGETFEEVRMPVFPEDLDDDGGGPVVGGIWCFAPGGATQADRLWLGTFPGGLFRSDDGGESFSLVRSLWEHPHRAKWFGGGRDTPGIHSIVVDPRDEDRLLIGVSCGGVYETEDGGVSWQHRNEGLAADFLPEPSSEVGQDPHSLSLCRDAPDVVWQQNHCGVYRSVDAGRTWTSISQKDGPVRFGFPIVAHPRDPNVAWVIPAKSDEERNAIGGALEVHRTDDGGATWRPLTEGLPRKNAFDLVYRHAFDGDGETLVFGSTTGNVFLSVDDGERWTCLGPHFPPVYSVRLA
jgi:hypothetical protein